MMNATNTYFLDLKRIGHEYEAARIERRARKQQIIDNIGWESEERFEDNGHALAWAMQQ